MIVQTFLKHAFTAAIVVGLFATMLETCNTKITAFVYSMIPITFLYLVGTCWYSKGRNEARDFSKVVCFGTAATLVFLMSWWILDSYDFHPAVHPVSSLLIWGFLATLVYMTVVR